MSSGPICDGVPSSLHARRREKKQRRPKLATKQKGKRPKRREPIGRTHHDPYMAIRGYNQILQFCTHRLTVHCSSRNRASLTQGFTSHHSLWITIRCPSGRLFFKVGMRSIDMGSNCRTHIVRPCNTKPSTPDLALLPKSKILVVSVLPVLRC